MPGRAGPLATRAPSTCWATCSTSGSATSRPTIRSRAQVVASLRGIADAGVPVAVMHGNRDFLLGERFARAAGAKLLPERVVVDAGGVPALLMHGDELCTDDADYQRYRAWIRDPRRQRRILALPWPVRRAFSAWLRRRSRNANRTKRDEIMDVNAPAVAQAFRDAGVARLVHGHTHRPATHALDVDGRRCERHRAARLARPRRVARDRRVRRAARELAP